MCKVFNHKVSNVGLAAKINVIGMKWCPYKIETEGEIKTEKE